MTVTLHMYNFTYYMKTYKVYKMCLIRWNDFEKYSIQFLMQGFIWKAIYFSEMWMKMQLEKQMLFLNRNTCHCNRMIITTLLSLFKWICCVITPLKEILIVCCQLANNGTKWNEGFSNIILQYNSSGFFVNPQMKWGKEIFTVDFR